MAYNKTIWQSLPSTDTPISTGNLNKIENGIYDNSVAIETINASINNIKGTILWTNSNPTQDFASQTITLSSSDYDVLEFYFRNSTATDNTYIAKVIKGTGTTIDVMINLNESISQETGIRFRNIIYQSNTSYEIGNGLTRGGSSAEIPTVTNNILIPIYVVGYKTGLFNV